MNNVMLYSEHNIYNYVKKIRKKSLNVKHKHGN
jgi:hypothetical protein